MDVSFTTAAANVASLSEDIKDLQGYTHAAYEIMNSLERRGISCGVNYREAPIGIAMGFPSDYNFAPGQYKIGYTAWESTELREGWLERMLMVDELWATSSWTAEVFKNTTGREDIFVYPHGITPDWRPVQRRLDDGPFRFLHVGEPQVRKNGQLVVDAFTELFGNDPNYQLILKCTNINTTRIYHDDGSIAGGPDAKYRNIIVITEAFTHKKMIELYQKTHAMIYPTTGEGFGFIPLQALATGMPTASTWEWAEYKDYITVPVNSFFAASEYQRIHPGNVYNVTKGQVKKAMTDLVDNYEKYRKEAFRNSFQLHSDFDWDRVTEPTATRLKNIL